jgi:hypothetical protein
MGELIVKAPEIEYEVTHLNGSPHLKEYVIKECADPNKELGRNTAESSRLQEKHRRLSAKLAEIEIRQYDDYQMMDALLKYMEEKGIGLGDG